MPIWNVDPGDLNPNPNQHPNPNLDDDTLAGNAMIMITKDRAQGSKVIPRLSRYVVHK